MRNINWYPGHMKKTRELIQENLKMVDAVVEVIDARIPVSSRNPIIDQLVAGKPRIIALNKSDLADETANRLWAQKLETVGSDIGRTGIDATGITFGWKGSERSVTGGDNSVTGGGVQGKNNAEIRVVPMNCMSGAGTKELLKVMESMDKKRSGNAAIRPFRIMIVGVPNVGKSSLINRMTGHKSTKTGDRPGVTKGKQWLKLPNGMQLLDTPGILWPKFEDPKAGMNLAFCGSIKDEILDVPSLGMELIKVLSQRYPELLISRYKLEALYEKGEESPETGYPMETPQDLALGNMHMIALKRGCILPGKRIDYERIGKLVLDEFRSATIGRITLEWPE
ncbi:MAG: ribosome biogenesis GTPase YlqF [Eubacteriales bacterium]|nr:ribosome biogenesis GTPase YlqF [Eubacteriales bacterium]